MNHMQGRIRDYNSSADTCTVELDALGFIESWLDSVKIDPAISRAFIVHGKNCTIAVPDEHRLDEAILVGVGDAPTSPTSSNATTAQKTETGRVYVATDGTGAGSQAVTYPAAFTTTAPALAASADNHITCTLSAQTITGFTVAVSGGPINSYVGVTWHATGNK